ncbi:MAG: hypothetical protein ACOCXA_08755 [Planctomycetota bacterium]
MVYQSDGADVIVSASEFYDAMRVRSSIVEFQRSFQHLMDVLTDWIKQHQDKIDRAFITPKNTGIMFLIQTKAVEYDEEFETALSRLDLKLITDSELAQHDISVETQAIPPFGDEALEAFLGPDDRTLEYCPQV